MPEFPGHYSPVYKVSVGEKHLLILMQNRSLFSIGQNSYGQCGLDINVKNEEITQFVDITQRIPKKSKACVVEQIMCGAYHSLALV